MGAGRRAGWLVLPAAAGLIAIVALTSRSGLAVPPVDLPDAASLYRIVEIVGYVALGVGVFAVPVAFALYRARSRTRPRRKREDAVEPLPLWLRVLGLGIVATVVAGQALVGSAFIDELRRTREAAGIDAPAAGGPDPGALIGNAGRDPTALIVAAALLVVLAVLAVAIALRWRALDRPTGLAPVERRRATHDALEVSLEALRREPDPRRAVIAAYAAMERSLATAGFERVRSEAPLEYLRRVLDVSGLADDHLRTITLLFQHARFSDHPVQESMRSQAIDALGGIRATLSGA